LSDDARHWTDIPDFNLPGGDIKGYWESARFDGFVVLALGWISTRREDFRLAIERWLASWCEQNPTNAGVQWKCGQEAGLRLMQMILVAELLQRWGGVRPTESFCKLVAQHCRRITPTIQYAIGQDNNHGTSEAAALFIGGAFLLRRDASSHYKQADVWCRTGRYWLEDRLQRLVLPDGSFSQHSINYHRLMLDTYSFAETFRRVYEQAAFTDSAYERCASATIWLATMLDSVTGDAPNLGANDGARLFVLHRLPFRDFRPAVQWASAVFRNCRAFASGPHDEVLNWLGINVAALRLTDNPSQSRLFANGGYAKLASADAWLLLRLPRYRFRPSHSDALHLDLWVRGFNLACDGGSFSYNTHDKWLNYFGGVESHNTVQFDGRDQMLRVSRFLFADWLECTKLEFNDSQSVVTAGYRDRWGAGHERTVHLLPKGGCTVVDRIDGFRTRAVLRWRLTPQTDDWSCVDGVWCSGAVSINIRSSVAAARFEKVIGWESKHYGAKTPVSVLELEVPSAATITTTFAW
jgi:hypothetical protein